ncbi:MAG: RES family NAD+ phosphorylase [Thermoleophilia bacterium]|nr:RES family NAD+ phosphorylase [Thermoleophilia bacterium]
MDVTPYELPDTCARLGWGTAPTEIFPGQGLVREPGVGGRFDDPSACYGILYCAHDPVVAIAEALAHVQPPRDGLLQRIAAETDDTSDDATPIDVEWSDAVRCELQARRLATIDLRSGELHAVDLRGDDTIEWLRTRIAPSPTGGAFNPEVVGQSGNREMTQRVGSLVIREQDADALVWEGRQHPGELCFAIIGEPGAEPTVIGHHEVEELEIDDQRVIDALDLLRTTE